MKIAGTLRERRILSRREDFGTIIHTAAGSIAIEVGNHTICLLEEEYWRLMEMLSEASMRVMAKRPGA